TPSIYPAPAPAPPRPRRRPAVNGQYASVPHDEEVEQTLADAFGTDTDDEDDEGARSDDDLRHHGGDDDRQRLLRAHSHSQTQTQSSPALGAADPAYASYAAAHDTASAAAATTHQQQQQHDPSATGAGTGAADSQSPTFFERMRGRNRGFFNAFSRSPASAAASRVMGGGSDGVFANLSAKPERVVEGEKGEDLPPTYEQAAADATPPYWETTIIAPGLTGDEVFVDGLPVGSIFSFLWNAMISTSFQLVGFLLTYLLHTTHAAKNGSRAGLGLTLVQYGFYMKGSDDDADGSATDGTYGDPTAQDGAAGFAPPDPNSHTFNPDDVDAAAAGAAAAAAAAAGAGGAADAAHGSVASDLSTTDMISYILMIVGWFILIRAVSDYLKARKHEQLILASPDRGLPVPIVAEGERPESSV
ncbi:hypothetical protein KEM52_001617, partial [Ascosphaera acerosa]